MDLDGMREFIQRMDSLANLGRGYRCFVESAFTPGKARLPHRLKKATKKFMKIHNSSSMVIMPQAQFVCINKNGQLIVCHTKY